MFDIVATPNLGCLVVHSAKCGNWFDKQCGLGNLGRKWHHNSNNVPLFIHKLEDTYLVFHSPRW